MKRELHATKPRLHIYPFSGEWILINDFDNSQNQKSFTSANQALEFAREILKSLRLEHEIVIHSRYDSMPHFRMTAQVEFDSGSITLLQPFSLLLQRLFSNKAYKRFQSGLRNLPMIIRIAKKKDAEQMLRIYTPFIRDNAVSFETEVPSLEEFENRIETYTNTYPWIVFEQENKITGYAYASQYRDRKAYRWSCECSVYVDEKFRGQGIAGKLYAALFEILKMQGFANVYAVITYPNPASLKFHIQEGFGKFAVYKNAGYKLGKWHDVHWYVKQILKPVKNPKEPIPFSELDRELLGEMLEKTSV